MTRFRDPRDGVRREKKKRTRDASEMSRANAPRGLDSSAKRARIRRETHL
jgi:hypothetical protein